MLLYQFLFLTKIRFATKIIKNQVYINKDNLSQL